MGYQPVPLHWDRRQPDTGSPSWIRSDRQLRSELERYLLAAMASTVSLAEETARIQKQTADALQALASGSKEQDIGHLLGSMDQAVQRLSRIKAAIRDLSPPQGSRQVQERRPGLRQVPRQSRPRENPPADPLTAREASVLEMMRGTLSLCEIGRELNVSKNTIKTHARAIYRKLGAADRPQAVQRGRELGIL